MPNAAPVPSIETPSTTFNRWIMRITDWVNALKNISTSGNITASVSLRTGVHLHVPMLPIAIAKTGGGGIPAQTSLAVGSGPITLYTFDGVGGNMAVDNSSSGNKDTGYNFSSIGTVGANKFVIVMKIYGYWFVISEEC